MSVGKNLKIFKKIKITGPGSISIGENCIIDGIKGDDSQHVTLGTQYPDSTISIGNNAKLHAVRITSKFQITIGDDVLLEEAGITDTDFHSIDKERGAPTGENIEKCKIRIGNRVCIGARSYVTKGVSIGDDAIVLPGSIVTTSVKERTIVCGNPARPVQA